eukprot:593338-Pyramimonas_sp.AAC.1
MPNRFQHALHDAPRQLRGVVACPRRRARAARRACASGRTAGRSTSSSSCDTRNLVGFLCGPPRSEVSPCMRWSTSAA